MCEQKLKIWNASMVLLYLAKGTIPSVFLGRTFLRMYFVVKKFMLFMHKNCGFILTNIHILHFTTSKAVCRWCRTEFWPMKLRAAQYLVSLCHVPSLHLIKIILEWSISAVLQLRWTERRKDARGTTPNNNHEHG